MKLKKIVARLVIIVGMVSLLGGCGMSKETLTKEQQDNVVRWIARGYDVETVEFLQLSKNTSTGIYLLSVRVDNDDSLQTTIPVDSLTEFDDVFGTVGLNPRNHFQQLERVEWFPKAKEIDISEIKVYYLEK
ncbi:hypothetical protein [Streptococcus fryi]